MAQKKQTRGSLEQRHRCLQGSRVTLGHPPQGAEWSGFVHTLCFLLPPPTTGKYTAGYG